MPATMAWPIRAARALLCALACLLPLAAPAAPPTLAQCHGIKDLAFVAHLDDDLLFMNPISPRTSRRAAACGWST